MTSAATNPMKQIYRRLRAVGFDTRYVRNTALPSWWDDDVAESPSGYQEGLVWLSRHLGVTLQSLQDETCPLQLRDFGRCNFKKSQGVSEEDLAVARTICTRAAQIAAASVQSAWRGQIAPNGSEIREQILNAGAVCVDLRALLDWCWGNGIPVLHVSNFPRSAKKMDGMAALIDGRPVIVICRNSKHQAWLLFILAHELGHLVRLHVSENGVLIDEQVVKDSVDDQEREANSTALEILTGDSDCRFGSPGRWPNARELAEMAVRYGKANHIDPGHIILNYSDFKGPEFFRLGNAALRLLPPDVDAAKIINDKMAENLDWSGIPEDSSEFLMRVVATQRHQ